MGDNSISFNDTTRQSDFDSGNYNAVYQDISNALLEKTRYDSTYDSTNNADVELMEDVNTFYTFLKGENRTKMNQIMEIVNNTPKDDFMDKYNNLEKKSTLKKSQNDNTKKTFIEKYLYLIIKCIFIIIVFGLFFTKIPIFNLDFSYLNIQFQNRIIKGKEELSKLSSKITQNVD